MSMGYHRRSDRRHGGKRRAHDKQEAFPCHDRYPVSIAHDELESGFAHPAQGREWEKESAPSASSSILSSFFLHLPIPSSRRTASAPAQRAREWVLSSRVRSAGAPLPP